MNLLFAGFCFCMSGKVSKYVNAVGLKFNRLTVLKEVEPKRYGKSNHIVRMMLCKCECGNETTVRLTNLVSGHPKSCGCLWNEKMKENKPNLIHGLSYSNLYMKWAKMKDRCYNENCKKYSIYGGRGIIVCEEWLSDFQSFYDWAIVNGYKKGLTLDRFPDTNGNYEPSNCRWATNEEQCNNKRNNKRFDIDGESMTLSEICKKYGVRDKYSTVHNRIFYLGWDIMKAIKFN